MQKNIRNQNKEIRTIPNMNEKYTKEVEIINERGKSVKLVGHHKVSQCLHGGSCRRKRQRH